MNIVVQGEYAIMLKKKGDSSISKSDLFSTPIPTAPTSHHLNIPEPFTCRNNVDCVPTETNWHL